MQDAAQLGVSEPSISAWELDKARPKAGRMEAPRYALTRRVESLPQGFLAQRSDILQLEQRREVRPGEVGLGFDFVAVDLHGLHATGRPGGATGLSVQFRVGIDR